MKPLAFSEHGRRQMIDHLLDTYNRYMRLYDALHDIHFKQEADRAMDLVKRICQ